MSDNRPAKKSVAPALSAVSGNGGGAGSSGGWHGHLGEVVDLMIFSANHEYLFLTDLKWALFPPLNMRQYYLARDEQGEVIGYVCWACVNGKVRLSAGISASEVSLSRNKFDLIISLSDSAGSVTDTLTVRNYYVSGAARIEGVELHDGALVWNAADFAAVSWTAPEYTAGAARITGGSGDEDLHGLGHTNDVFDGAAGGNDRLHGYGGDDVYYLGRGTGQDTIVEYWLNGGDAEGVIRLKSGIGVDDVRLRRSADGGHIVLNTAQLAQTEGKYKTYACQYPMYAWYYLCRDRSNTGFEAIKAGRSQARLKAVRRYKQVKNRNV